MASSNTERESSGWKSSEIDEFEQEVERPFLQEDVINKIIEEVGNERLKKKLKFGDYNEDVEFYILLACSLNEPIPTHTGRKGKA